MLAEIAADRSVLGEVIGDPTDPAFVTRAQARLVVRGHSVLELNPIVYKILSRRLPHVPGYYLRDDLLFPMKKGLGNALKWGHHRDLTQWITVDITATERGVVLAIVDEGRGFDVAGVVRRFERGEGYFVTGGSGMIHFAAARSKISWSDGGRVFLLRFLCDDPNVPRADRELEARFGTALDSSAIRHAVSFEIPRFMEPVTVEMCRVERIDASRGEVTYVLHWRAEGAKPSSMASKLFVIGRLAGSGSAPAGLDSDRTLESLGSLRQPPMTLFVPAEC